MQSTFHHCINASDVETVSRRLRYDASSDGCDAGAASGQDSATTGSEVHRSAMRLGESRVPPGFPGRSLGSKDGFVRSQLGLLAEKHVGLGPLHHS